MTLKISSPLEQDEVALPISRSPQPKRSLISKAGVISLLVLLGLLLLSLTGRLLFTIWEGISNTGTSTSANAQAGGTSSVGAQVVVANANQDPTEAEPIALPNNTALSQLQVAPGRYVLYEQDNKIYYTEAAGGPPHLVSTPGYIYNQAIRPVITPTGQLLYSGAGLWLTDIFGGTPMQLATLTTGQVITSVALSADGTTIAWSVEPADGKGNIDIFAGPLTSSHLVYEQSTANCPCFGIFGFLYGFGEEGDNTLLLTDTRGSHEAVQNGLWELDLTQIPPLVPLPLLSEDPQQGPLAMAPLSNILLYSTSEGVVPVPDDQSVPTEIASLTYANSLSLTTVGGQPLALSTSRVILPEQHNLTNSADYHWITTPLFSPDGHTLVYVEFSSDAQTPFDRHSAIFSVAISGSGTTLHIDKPQLVATASVHHMELGTWLDDHTLTFYGDGTLYAFDFQKGALATILQTGSYARILAIMSFGPV